jgi:hypothetical protein
VTVLVLLLVGRALPLWALRIIAVATVLAVATVGAMQLRHDQRLTERNFLKLMLTVLARLPSLLRSRKSDTDDRPAEQGPGSYRFSTAFGSSSAPPTITGKTRQCASW